MQNDYAAFIAKVIKQYEGNYCWDKGDPGGPTNFGITCFDLAEHRGQKMTSMAAWAPIVKAMTLQEAEDIYATKYAVKCLFNQLRAGPDCVCLDYGINSGIGRPIRVSQALLKTTVTGSALADAINKTDPKWFVDAMCQERLHFMHAIRGGSAWAEFGHGWGARVADLKTYCDHLASGGAVPAPAPIVVPKHPKAQHGDPQIVHNTAGKVTGGAAGAGTAVSTGHPYIAAAVCAGVVGMIGLAIYENRKAQLANIAVILPPTIPPVVHAA